MIYKRLDSDVGFGVSRNIPGRKKPCLMVQKGNCQYKVASFNNEEAATYFEKFMEEFLGPWIKEGSDKIES